jgi:hypothetical protein
MGWERKGWDAMGDHIDAGEVGGEVGLQVRGTRHP